ncbi:MAG: dTDP-4-dehydrorhamnose reductase [Rhodospirillaceae bacterium]|nr:dTDP-4-dehydrorhamnose reductase [Rhodospirillaceae bacterium]
MADLLITGADGQVGWELARRAKAAGLDAVALGRAGLDIADRTAVARVVAEAAPRVVVNAAAYTGVDQAEREPDLVYAVNRDGPGFLGAACAGPGALLVHISTDYVFDGSNPAAYGEGDATAPLGVYGASKLAGEAAVGTSGARHVILRTSWVYGVHGRNFVKTMLRLAAERERLGVVDDQRGCPTFAGDLADALLALATRELAGGLPPDGLGTFHCAGQGATTWCGFARAIFRLVASALPRVPVVDAITTADYPTAARRPANSVLDCGRLAAVHGLALRPWPDALAEMLGTFLAGVEDAPAERHVQPQSGSP